MGDISKHFAGLDYSLKYDFRNKKENVTNYVKYMLNRSLAMFSYKNLPDSIPQKELEKMLQCNGYCAIAKINGELYALNGAFGGQGDVYGRPTKIIINNTYLKYNKEHTIDEDVVIIPSDSMYMGLIPLYEKYCTMLNESDVTIILATINKRIQILLSANDDNTVQSAKRFLQDVEDGKLGVIAESKLFDSLKVNNSANGNKVDLQDLFEMHQYIKASLFNEIGLGSNNNMKKERLAVAEIEVNSDNLYPLIDDMLDNRRKSLEKVNKMFGTDIQVEFNSSWDYRLYQGEPVETLEEHKKDGEIIEPTIEPIVEPIDEPIIETTDADVDNINDEVVEDVEPTDEPKDEPTDEQIEEPKEDEEKE